MRLILVAALTIGTGLRIAFALRGGIHHPDELIQYLEQAYRHLFGYGAVPWEYRAGIRSPLPSLLLSVPMGIGAGMDRAGDLYLILPRVTLALCSLSLIWSAFELGRRIAPLHALVAGLCAAIWIEFLAFAAHPLTEQMATVLAIPACVLLSAPKEQGRMKAGLAGSLLMLAVVLRFQYAPALGTAALLLCGKDWRNKWLPFLAGAAFTIVWTAGLDIAGGRAPFAWMWLNLQQNLFFGHASSYGIDPASFYLADIARMWSIWTIPLVGLAPIGARRYPALFVMAIVNIVVHMAIGHKEYRFILLSTSTLALLAMIGTADGIALLSRGQRTPENRLVLLSITGWALASVTLWSSYRAIENFIQPPAIAEQFALLRKSPPSCGFAMIGMPYWHGGAYATLHASLPFYNFLDAMKPDDARLFDTAMVREEGRGRLPENFHPLRCDPGFSGKDRICLYRRTGGCSRRNSPAELNRLLEVTGN